MKHFNLAIAKSVALGGAIGATLFLSVTILAFWLLARQKLEDTWINIAGELWGGGTNYIVSSYPLPLLIILQGAILGGSTGYMIATWPKNPIGTGKESSWLGFVMIVLSLYLVKNGTFIPHDYKPVANAIAELAPEFLMLLWGMLHLLWGLRLRTR